MEHETKHEEIYRREDELSNLWRTRMTKIPTKLEKLQAPPL